MKDLLVILAILILCFEFYRLLRGNWIRRFLKKKKGDPQPRKPRVMKPKSERDCPFCVEEKRRTQIASTRNARAMAFAKKGEEDLRNDNPQVDQKSTLLS